jgi:NADPH:quinone reductase-like Zn-dependent oxidoreductase
MASLPMTMRGIVHNQKLQTLAYSKALPLPTAGSNEVLLKVSAAAITRGELDWPRPPELNESFPGVDMAGNVVSAPEGSKFNVGDKVYMRSEYPRAGSAREYSIGLEKELAIRPKNISAEEAAAAPVSALTAWQALFVHAGLPSPLQQTNGADAFKKYRVLVNGASGAVGLWKVQLAHLAGCTVVGTCTSSNAEMVRRMGADEVIDYTQTSISAWSKDNEKVDLLLDCVGGKSRDDAWHAIKDHGKLFSIVPPPDMNWVWTYAAPEGVSSTIIGKFFIMEPNGEHLGLITTLIEQGKVRPIVDSVYKLEEYQKAFDRMNSKRAVGKVVLKIEQE